MGTERRGDLTASSTRSAPAVRDARDRLVRAIYAELRRIAGGLMRHERPGHTLQPSALVHEALLRLLEGRHPGRRPQPPLPLRRRGPGHAPGAGRPRPAPPRRQARGATRPRAPGRGPRLLRGAGPRRHRPARGPRPPGAGASPAGPGRRPPLLRRAVGPRGRRAPGGLGHDGGGRLAVRPRLAARPARGDARDESRARPAGLRGLPGGPGTATRPGVRPCSTSSAAATPSCAPRSSGCWPRTREAERDQLPGAADPAGPGRRGPPARRLRPARPGRAHPLPALPQPHRAGRPARRGGRLPRRAARPSAWSGSRPPPGARAAASGGWAGSS